MPETGLGSEGLVIQECMTISRIDGPGYANGAGKGLRLSLDDEKTSLLRGGEAGGLSAKHAEARDSDDNGGTNGGTFTQITSTPLMAEGQSSHGHQAGQHAARKPSISIVDGYNSPVRRGGYRSYMEVDEEAAAGSLSRNGWTSGNNGGIIHRYGSGDAGSHVPPHACQDHCVIARRETEQAERLSNKVRFAVHASICANVLLSMASAYAAFRSGSLAVLASLVDTLLDLISQVVLSVAEHGMRKPSDEHYPAGRSRIEPVGVIIVSVIMGVAALELLRASVGTLVLAIAYGKLPHLDMEPVTVGIMVCAVGVKLSLYLYSSTLAGVSGTAEALAEDHKNDIMTNSFSVLSSTVAHYYPKAWFVDPIGAIVISCLIFYNWLHVGMDHASKIVGLSAPPETLEHISDLAGQHHAQLELDIIRAYHFGPNFLVELEVVLPWDMNVKEAHDIALGLQQKVEQQSFVERCFVHVDYQVRGYNEHKI